MLFFKGTLRAIRSCRSIKKSLESKSLFFKRAKRVISLICSRCTLQKGRFAVYKKSESAIRSFLFIDERFARKSKERIPNPALFRKQGICSVYICIHFRPAGCAI